MSLGQEEGERRGRGTARVPSKCAKFPWGNRFRKQPSGIVDRSLKRNRMYHQSACSECLRLRLKLIIIKEGEGVFD